MKGNNIASNSIYVYCGSFWKLMGNQDFYQWFLNWVEGGFKLVCHVTTGEMNSELWSQQEGVRVLKMLLEFLIAAFRVGRGKAAERGVWSYDQWVTLFFYSTCQTKPLLLLRTG